MLFVLVQTAWFHPRGCQEKETQFRLLEDVFPYLNASECFSVSGIDSKACRLEFKTDHKSYTAYNKQGVCLNSKNQPNDMVLICQQQCLTFQHLILDQNGKQMGVGV